MEEKKNEKSVTKVGDMNFVKTSVGTFGVYLADSMTSYLATGDQYELFPTTVAGQRVASWGDDNNLPANIRNLLERNHLAPGILDREIGLTWGQGPHLYSVEVADNEIQRKWVIDDEIQAWLDSWDYKQFIRDCMTEYKYLRGEFVKYYPAKRVRIGEPWINKLECIHSTRCRLLWPDSGEMKDVNQIIYGNFETYLGGFSIYPKFDKYVDLKGQISIGYHNFRSFAREFYSLPSFFGAIPWIKRSNDIPEIIAYLTDNMIAAAYHVHEPQGYWEKKREKIMQEYTEATAEELDAKLDDLRDEVITQIANVLAGKHNVGKFFTSVDFYDEDGNLCQWKIEPVQMNIKDYIEAQTKISTIAESATTSGIGLHPSLSNIIIGGQLNSGSQLLYALKLYLSSDTSIPEEVILDPINIALKINFPTKNLRMGFYHQVVMTESNVNPADRVAAKA